MKRPRGVALVLLALVVLLLDPSLLHAQCPLCKTLLTNSPEGRAISGRFNVAILVMLVAPYLIAGGVFLAVFRDRIMLALRERLFSKPTTV